MLKLLHLIAPYLVAAFGESVQEQGSAGEGLWWRSALETAAKNLSGERFCQRVVKCFAHATVLVVSLSLTQQAIFVEVVEEECPTQMCGRIIKSFNLSMPDRTPVRGKIIKGFSLSELIYYLFFSLLHPSPRHDMWFPQALQH